MTAPALKRLPELLKPWIELLQGIATILALAAGLVWFFLQSSTHPNVKLEQTITQRHLQNARRFLISVDVRVTNIGKMKVPLKQGALEVYERNPVSVKKPIKEQSLDSPLLEPGENAQALFYEFTIPDDRKTILVRSWYRVPNSDKYWSLEGLADLGTDQSQSQAASTEKTTPSPLPD